MCKDVQRFFYSEMVAPFLSFDGRGPSLCVELVTMNFAFVQSLTDWIWLVQAQWQINCTWSVAETIIRPGESGLDSTRLDSARQILSVWRMMMITIKFDMIILIMTWFDMINLYNWKYTGAVLHITETHLTHRNRWMWSRCSTHGTESRWARWTIDIHRHPSTWTNTSWTVVQRCAALNICWAEVDHMPWNVGKEGRPGGDKMRRTSDEHLRKSWNLTLQATIIYNSSDTRGISWIWCCGMLWVGFLPGSQLELSVSCQPWVTGCAAAPLPNGCLIVCGGSCNVFLHVFPVDVSSCGAAMVRPA